MRKRGWAFFLVVFLEAEEGFLAPPLGAFLVDLVDEIGFFLLEEGREVGRDEVFLDDLAFLEGGDTDFFGLLMSIP